MFCAPLPCGVVSSESPFRVVTRGFAGRARAWLAPRALDELPMAVEEPDRRGIYRVLNLALRAGEVMMSSGAGTIEVEATILDVTRSCGLQRCEIDVTFTSMTVSYIRGDDVEPITAMLVVRVRAVDYGRLAAVHELRVDLNTGRIGLEEATARLDAIRARRQRRYWLVVLGWCGMAAAFTVLLGGGVLVAAVAFVSTATVYVANRFLNRAGLPDFFLSTLGAAVATAFAMLLAATDSPANSSLVVAGGIMVLVPGYALVASTQDVLTGFPLSGGARGLEVVLTASGIVTGVAASLYASVSLGVPMHLGPVQLAPLSRLPLQVLAAGVATALYGMATSVPRRELLLSGTVGAVGWGTYLALSDVGASLIFTTAVAAVVVGLMGNLIATRRRTNPFLFVVPGVMPLVPGLTIYEGMLYLFQGQAGSGASTLLRAAAIGLAIAAGVVLGNMAVHPLRRPSSPIR